MKGKILVTGGAGYIGSHTVVELQQAGHEIVIIDNFSNSYPQVIDQVGKITGIKPASFDLDLKKEAEVNDFFKNHHDFDGVIHFAALKAVGESTEKPLAYYHNNLTSLLLLLNEMQKHGMDNLVFSSSCTVYGQPDVLPVTEQTPTRSPESPYGNTKKVAEEIIRDVSKASGLQSISLRYFNPVGAHDSAQIGELPFGVPNNLIPFVTQSAAGRRGPVTVFGSDYPTPDGSAVRDYIHVVDLAKAHVIAIERLLTKKNKSGYEVFNLGTGKGSSVLEVLRAFERSTGVKLNYQIGDRRPGDITRIYADTDLANRELGWRAERDLDNMMRTAWQWESNIPDFVK